jgi:hypothetical protein
MKVNQITQESRFDRRDAYQRDYDSSVSGMGRGDDHRGLRQELAHERNNIQIAINGRPWKVVAGRGTADSAEERSHLESMKQWAERKSTSSGKKWTVYLTGAEVSEGQGVAEGLTEFAADDGNDGGEDDALRNYARMWWAGDEATQMQIEAALAKMGWEIGEDEGGYDNGGVFVVRAGDENGDSYTSWAAEDLTEGMAEGSKKSEPPEADYGADYQDMVSRVKKLAGMGPLKTVYDPNKRVYRNVPTAVQPPKK